MTMNENQRDQELDALLEPLRASNPDDITTARWQAALRAEKSASRKRRLSRIVEWALAASFGFVLAVVVGRFGADHKHEETAYSGIDATEMRLVANTE
jgi:hypothetical protein